MRSIINISLPKETARMAKIRAEKAGFASMSEYMRALLDMDNGLISAEKLLEMTSRAEREYKKGKMGKYKSLADLLVKE
jgi:Arc/MetJ-type ribon-helix-helix transcriptional regulator